MNYLLTLLELSCLSVICIVLGRAVLGCLPRVLQLNIGFYIAPILGLSVLTLVATLYGWLWPFQFIPSIVMILLLVMAALYLDKRRRRLPAQVGILLGFIFLCSLPVLMPLIHYGGYNPFTDIFTYLAQSQWLQSHPFAEKATASGYYPTLTQITLYQKTGSRMGGTFLLGYVQSLFGLKWSYDAYMATVSLAFVTGCLAIGGLARQVIPLKKHVVLAISLLPALLMNGYVFGAEWGFYPQTLGLSFAAGLAALLPSLTQVVGRCTLTFSKRLTYAIPAALCAAGLLFAYNEPFPIFTLALGLFFIVACLTYKKYLSQLLVFFGLFVTETLLLINYEAIRIFNNIFQTLGISGGHAAIGWPVLWSPIQLFAHAFGLKSPFNHRTLSFDTLLSTWVAPVFFLCLAVILFRFIKNKPKRRMALVFLLAVDTVLLLFILNFRYLSPSMSPGEVGHTFLQYKLIQYATPFSFGLTAIAVGIVWFYRPRYRALLAILGALIALHAVYFHGFRTPRNLTTHVLQETNTKQDPFNVLLQLREGLSAIPKDKVIHLALGTEHSKLRQMVAYILHDRKVSSNYQDDGYLLGNLPPNERNMPSDEADYILYVDSATSNCKTKGQKIPPFLLVSPPYQHITIESATGGHAFESNGQDAWHWVPQDIHYRYNVVGTPERLKFSFTITPHDSPRQFNITLTSPDDKVLYQATLQPKPSSQHVESPWIDITSLPTVMLHVKASGEPKQLSRRDTREASFKIANLSVCVR